MVPPCCGWGWQTSAMPIAAWSGSSSRASRRPAGPARNRLSILRGIGYGLLIRPVIGELHVDAEVVSAQERNDLLQRVAILGGNADEIALDGSLRFLLAVLDGFDDIAGLL